MKYCEDIKKKTFCMPDSEFFSFLCSEKDRMEKYKQLLETGEKYRYLNQYE